jgi:hypothetical protein
MSILLLALLRNDDDGQMKEMTDAIAKSMTKRGQDFTRIDYTTSSIEQLRPDGSYGEVIFTGHSRFFAGEQMKPLQMSERKLGGYDIEPVSALVVHLIFSCKTRTVSMWCCESALNVNTKTREDGGQYEVLVNLSDGMVSAMEMVPDAKVSTVGKIACDLWKIMHERHFTQPVVIRGLNGVGDVSTTGEVMTFDQDYLHLYNDLTSKKIELSKATNTGKKESLKQQIEAKEQQIQQKVDSKQSAHIFGFNLAFNPLSKYCKKTA